MTGLILFGLILLLGIGVNYSENPAKFNEVLVAFTQSSSFWALVSIFIIAFIVRKTVKGSAHVKFMIVCLGFLILQGLFEIITNFSGITSDSRILYPFIAVSLVNFFILIMYLRTLLRLGHDSLLWTDTFFAYILIGIFIYTRYNPIIDMTVIWVTSAIVVAWWIALRAHIKKLLL